LASFLQNVVCLTLIAELGTVIGNTCDSFVKRYFKKFSFEGDDYDPQEDLFGVMTLIKDAQIWGSSSPGRLNFVAHNILDIQYGTCFVSPS